MALNTWWTGDDTVNDSSGNGHNLTRVTDSYGVGKLNDCFSVTTTNEAGEVATYETMGGTRTLLSAFAWIKSNNNVTTNSLQITGKYDINNNRQWRMDLNTSTGVANGYFTVFLSTNGTAATKKYVYETDLTDNTWHHVGFTYLGTGTGVLTLYVDGVAKAVNKVTDVAGTTLYNSTSKVAMGCYHSAGVKTQNFSGLIDEVRIYDNVLSDADVLSLYNSYFAPRFQINIGDSWKAVAGVQINIGDSWKAVPSAKINIGDSWKAI